MSQAPATLAGLPAPTIAAGVPADLCLVDVTTPWTVEATDLHSRSANSAWLGRTVKGRVRLTVAAGRVAYDDRA